MIWDQDTSQPVHSLTGHSTFSCYTTCSDIAVWLLGIQACDAYLELLDKEQLVGLEAVLDAQAKERAQAQAQAHAQVCTVQSPLSAVL